MALRPLQHQAYGGRKRKGPHPCGFDACVNITRRGIYCPGHAKQRRQGRKLKPLKKWQPHPTLDGWSKPWVERRGYAYVSRQAGEKRPEHRVVMELMIGRPLLPDENVHHLNGNRADNRPENLELWCTLQPPGQRIDDKVRYAWEIINRYDPSLISRRGA